MKNKKGAFELSVSTIVIIVIAMALLVMGLVLIRNIFTGATESVDTINDRVKDQISGLFSNEGADVVVKLGEGKVADIKANDEIFGVAFGARTPDGSEVGSRTRLRYKLSLEQPSGNNCASVLGQSRAESLFVTKLNTDNPFDEFDGANAFAIVEMRVPKGTATCSQKVLIDVKDSEAASQGYYAGSFFKIEIGKSGLL